MLLVNPEERKVEEGKGVEEVGWGSPKVNQRRGKCKGVN